jgi:hypothetical protein
VPFAAGAEELFDGTKPLFCASIEANGCASGEPCEKDLPETMGAPQFMKIDFAKKEITGPRRSTPILHMEKSEEQILLQGIELGMGWVLALDRMTGKFSATLADHVSGFVIFGVCTSNF